MEMLPVNFSKILITGNLNPSMPYIVLRELAFELEIIASLEKLRDDVKYWVKIFKKLTKLNPFTIVNYEQDKDKIINIVNPTTSWDLHSLKNAFEHMIYFALNPILDNLEINNVGIQTKEKIKNYNACMLYSICRANNIFTPLDSSYEDLKTLAEQAEEMNRSINDEEDQHSSSLVESPLIFDVESISPIIPRSLDSIIEKEFHLFSETEPLKSEANLLTDLNYVLKLVEPINDNQAIILGSLLFSKDFSNYINPLREFRRCKINLPTSPHDFKIKLVEKINPFFSDLNLYFNPYLPQNAYDTSIINHHISLFSFSFFDFENTASYEILQELHLEENFHIGYLPNIFNNETPILLEQVDTLENGDIVCFGVKHENLKATTWKELKEIFKNMNMFINPFEKKSVFTKDQIERLYKIGRWILGNIHFSFHNKFKYLFEGYSKSTTQDIKDCLDVIDQIKFFHQSNFVFLESLMVDFNNRNKTQKDQIINGIQKMFEITMYMRGWNGISENYPIQNAPYPTDANSHEQKILENIFELDEINYRTNNFIYKLPLMLWKNEFVQSVLEEQGLTIGERIKIVKSGESEGVHSCVRMSSNVLGSSYCFYCRTFNIPSKFDINLLSYIQ